MRVSSCNGRLYNPEPFPQHRFISPNAGVIHLYSIDNDSTKGVYAAHGPPGLSYRVTFFLLTDARFAAERFTTLFPQSRDVSFQMRAGALFNYIVLPILHKAATQHMHHLFNFSE